MYYVGPLTAMGAGRSKKEAKHAAAKSLIDKLTGSNLADTFRNLNGAIIPHNISNSCCNNIGTNPAYDNNNCVASQNIITPIIKE